MNKSSKERLSQLVVVAAGLYDEANQQLDNKKKEYTDNLKRQTQTTTAAHDKLQKLQAEYADYQKTENPDPKRLNKLKSDVAEAEKAYLRLDGILYSATQRNFDNPDIVKAAKERIRSEIIEGHHETMRDPLLKNDPVILDNLHMEELVRLSEEQGSGDAEKAAFIRLLVVEAVGTCLRDRIESRNNLLADYQLYQTEGGFSQELYQSLGVLNEQGEKNPGLHHGVLSPNGADEYVASSNKNQKHQSNLREVANKFGIVDATIEQEIASSHLSSAADRMYSRLSVPRETVNVGGEVTQLMWADRVFQACQIKQAAAILFPTLDVKRGLTFDNVLENFNDKRLAEDLNESTYKGCVVKHAVQLNDLRRRLDIPSNLKFGAASLPGGDRAVIENGNGIRVLMNVSDQLIKQIGTLQKNDEQSTVILLNLLSEAYSSSTMNSPRDFFSSPEIHGAIQQLVTMEPSVMQDREFIGALASYNRMAEHFGVSPLNLGEKNNAIINAHVIPLDVNNKIFLRGLAKDLGTHFDFQPSDEAEQNINGKFNGWVRSPEIFADLKNPELMTRGSEIPSVIEFKDGAKIISDGGDLVLSGFSPEKMKSFHQGVLLKEFKGEPEIVSTDPKFHQQVAAEFSAAQPQVLKRRESQIIEQRLSKKLRAQSQLGLSAELPTLKSRGTVLQSKRKETGAVPKSQESAEEQKQTSKGDKQVSFSDSMDDTMSAGSSKESPRGFSSDDSSEEVSPRIEGAVRGKITPRGEKSKESAAQKNEAAQSFLGTAWNAFLKFTNVGALMTAASEAWNRTRVSVGVSSATGVQEVESKAKNEAGKYQYNQVVLLGEAEKNFKKPSTMMEEKFGQWIEANKDTLKISNGKTIGNYPIEFEGGQRIELSSNGKDVVMKGFSASIYESFGGKMYSGKLPKCTVSAADGKSYKNIETALNDVNVTKSFESRLSSIGLFFQKQWDTMSTFASGLFSKTTPAIATPSQQKTASSSEASQSQMFIDSSHSNLSPNDTTQVRVDNTSQDNVLSSAVVHPQEPVKAVEQPITNQPPIVSSAMKEPTVTQPPVSQAVERAGTETHTPAQARQALPQFIREKLTVSVITQGEDVGSIKESLQKFVQEYNKDHPNSKDQAPALALRIRETDNEFKADMALHDGSMVRMTMNKDNQEVIFKAEVPTSVTCEVISNVVTKLPKEGASKDVVVESQGEHGKMMVESLKKESHQVKFDRDSLKPPTVTGQHLSHD